MLDCSERRWVRSVDLGIQSAHWAEDADVVDVAGDMPVVQPVRVGLRVRVACHSELVAVPVGPLVLASGVAWEHWGHPEMMYH